MRIIQHIIFWVVISTFLVITFAQADDDYVKSIYFVTFLMPVAIGTSYFFNYYLVPVYLLKQKYFSFGLYLTYTLIFSLYLEMVVLTISLIVLANYQYENLNPYSTNMLLLTSTIYLIVFVSGFVLLIKRYQRKEHLIARMEENQTKNQQLHLVVKADRKNIRIPLNSILYIESLSDYVKIHTTEGSVITREKISELSEKLPDAFIRTHRSFLVNGAQISFFGKETITISDVDIPISRTYKKEVMCKLSPNPSATQ